jgi:hypothetical protein
MSKRSEAMQLLNKNVPAGVEIQSERDKKRFEELTYTSHKTLTDNWSNGGIMTACNGFVGWYAVQMGIVTGKKDDPKIASWFRLEESMRAIGKGHAWVSADGRSEPQEGDILHHYKDGTGLHVDVCMGFDKAHKLMRAAAGQGKPPKYDVLKQVTGTAPYNYRNLLGWLDLEQFFWQPPYPGSEPMGHWVFGWWKVYDGNQYYYYFYRDGRVQYTEKPPATPFAPPKAPVNFGTYTYEPGRQIVIEWNPVDGGPTIETFSAQTDLKAMNGTSNKYAPLYASRYTPAR